MKVIHEFPPYYNKDSNILILGSIPSIKSREIRFYCGHPQNRFWRILKTIYGEEVGPSIGEKQEFLKRHHIALWDVLHSCEIKGSYDASIQNPVPNDLSQILDDCPNIRIYTTGKKAHDLYQKYCYPQTKKEDIPLPSTSPANAQMSFETLVNIYSQIL